MRILTGASLIVALCGCQPSKEEVEASVNKVPPAIVAAVMPLQTQTKVRMSDLVAINNALQRYAIDHAGAFPVSDRFQGYKSEWGASLGAEWIPELKPYLDPLPRDPAKSENAQEAQYLYKSDGKDYKLIVHQSNDCVAGVEKQGIKVDPMRVQEARCWAYGYWTEGGEAF